jgi:hypothetical protein
LPDYELRYWYPFRRTSFLHNPPAQHQAQVDDREAWLAGVQKRLCLVTRGNVNELLAARLADLGSATWPS